MPRKRPELDREEKVEQILRAAVAILRDDSDENLTINRIATDLGLARAAVYWYFPSRDELFVAAAARMLSEAFSKPPTRRSYLRRIEWAVDTLAELQGVYVALQTKAVTVPAAAHLLDGFQRTLCERLKDLLAPHVDKSRLQGVADTTVMFVEGLLGRRLPPAERTRHLRFALSTLIEPQLKSAGSASG